MSTANEMLVKMIAAAPALQAAQTATQVMLERHRSEMWTLIQRAEQVRMFRQDVAPLVDRIISLEALRPMSLMITSSGEAIPGRMALPPEIEEQIAGLHALIEVVRHERFGGVRAIAESSS